MDAKSLVGIAVVSVTEAARLGRVADVLFDTNPLRVAALKATTDKADFAVPFDQIRKIGSDAVMVDRPEATQMSSADGTFGRLNGLDHLEKLKIVDDAGTFIGTLQKVDFDVETGHVERLQARRGGILGAGGTTTTIEAGAVHSVGDDVLTIAAEPHDAGRHHADRESDERTTQAVEREHTDREPGERTD
jgi:sporulation protein YlmC with PRC-barrel domain